MIEDLRQPDRREKERRVLHYTDQAQLAALEIQCEKLASALRQAQCACTLRERDSGHRVGCWKPDADEVLAELKPKPAADAVPILDGTACTHL